MKCPVNIQFEQLVRSTRIAHVYSVPLWIREQVRAAYAASHTPIKARTWNSRVF